MGNECPQGHKLKKFKPKRYGFRCDDCGDAAKPTDTLHGCRKCDYDLCETCVSKSDDEEVKCKRCIKNGEVRRLAYATADELTEIDSGYVFGFICNRCRKSFESTGSYNCKYCNYDLCRNCYNKVKINGDDTDDSDDNEESSDNDDVPDSDDSDNADNDEDDDDDDEDDDLFGGLLGSMIKHQMEEKMEELVSEIKREAEEAISSVADDLEAEKAKNLDLTQRCGQLENELTETKSLLKQQRFIAQKLQKQLDDQSKLLHEDRHKTAWKRKKIDKWTMDDVLFWVQSMSFDMKWQIKLIEEMIECKCNGKDIVGLQSPQEIGEAFESISRNKRLCDELFVNIKLLKSKQSQKGNKFKINISSHDKRITLNRRVAKYETVGEIKKLYKEQYGVEANLDDIQLYSKRKNLPTWKTLQQVGITDDRHLITVKFTTNGVVAPKCPCGMLLQQMLSSTCYEGGGVICDVCLKPIGGNEYAYHCAAKKTEAHGNGYDICVKCTANL